MKGSLCCIVLCGMLIVFSSFAQDGRHGVGMILGEPTGLSGKLMLSERNAIDAGLAWSFRRDGHIHLHADYLWQFSDVIRSSEQLTLFTGVGGRFAAGKGNGVVGLRLVGGLAWLPTNTPLEIFTEFAPILDVIPATELNANGGVGLRFYF